MKNHNLSTLKSGLTLAILLLLSVGINHSNANVFDDQNNIHRLFLRQHDVKGKRVFSEERLKDLVEKYTSDNDSVGLFFCHLGISLANTDQDKVKMIDHIIKAYAYIPESEVDRLTPYLNLVECISYFFLGKYHDALAKTEDLRESFTEPDQKPEAMVVMFYNSLCLAVTGETEKAQMVCDNTNLKISKLNDLSKEIKSLLELHQINAQGLIYNFQNNIPKAEEYFKKGLEMAKSIKEGRYISNFYGNLSTIYIQNGKWEDAIENARLDYAYSLRNNDKRSQFALTGVFAESYYRLNKKDSADKYIVEMLRLLPSSYDTYFVDNNRDFLLDYYLETNQPKKLIEVINYFNRVLDSLTQVRVEKDYEIIRSQIDLESAKEQIDQLKRINSLEKQKNEAVRKYNIALIIGFIAILLLIYYMYKNLLIRKRRNQLLENKNEEINQKNEELLTQKEDIIRQSERIYELNKLLEQKVDERTKEIVQKNKKLSDYAFHNSHHIRGPLARILGIISLWDNGHITESEKASMLKKVGESAKELDQMVRDVNKLLD